MSFKEFVQAVKDVEIKYPVLKAAMLAQSYAECGREDTYLASKYNNHWGMKFRPEMAGFATSVYYPTDTEPTGGADFCEFLNKKAAVVGYWKFVSRSPYKGWEAHAGSAEEFLAFIGKIWCPPGYTTGWMASHGGLNYHQSIMKNYYPEAVKLLAEKIPVPAPTSGKGKVMINCGHAGSAGARGKNPAIKEEFFNAMQGKEIQKILNSHGIMCDIINQDKVGGLDKVGQAAKDYDLAIALHENAYDKKEHGPSYLGGKNKPKSRAFANKLVKRLADAFGYPVLGFLDMAVTVTLEMDKTACPIAFLLETEMIDDEIDIESFTKDVLKSAQIIAQCIIEELVK